MSLEIPTDVNLPKVEIHATDLCNNRCGFCTTGLLNHERYEELRHPPRAFIREKLEEAYRRGARRALFQGGEPTLRRDLGDLLSDAHEIGYQVTTIFTNARMAASRAGATWMARMNVTWFQVSIQGGTAEAHDESVGARGAWAQTVAGTRRLIELGQRVKVNGVLTRHLLDTLPEFADLMCSLRPEEVGMDTVKPSSAFTESFADYADLCPPLSRYSAALRDALLQMNDAGVIARLTSFPPCLVPGAEAFVSEEAASTVSQHHDGSLMHKLTWKREMMEKPERCRECVYDPSCGGVYEPYAKANGLDELHPLRERKQLPRLVHATAVRDVPLTRALRALFVRGNAARTLGARDVRRLSDGAHELRCELPSGALDVLIRPLSAERAYAHTALFDVIYRGSEDGHTPDLRIVDAVVNTLRRAESYLRPLAAATGERPTEPTAR